MNPSWNNLLPILACTGLLKGLWRGGEWKEWERDGGVGGLQERWWVGGLEERWKVFDERVE